MCSPVETPHHYRLPQTSGLCRSIASACSRPACVPGHQHLLLHSSKGQHIVLPAAEVHRQLSAGISSTPNGSSAQRLEGSSQKSVHRCKKCQELTGRILVRRCQPGDGWGRAESIATTCVAQCGATWTARLPQTSGNRNSTASGYTKLLSSTMS